MNDASSLLLAAGSAAAAVALLLPSRTRLAAPPTPAPAGGAAQVGVGHRPAAACLAAVLCGAGGWLFVGGTFGPVVGVVAAGAGGGVVLRAEPGDVRRRREEVARDLPALVDLFAATLRAGAGAASALGTVCDALPGAASDRLATARGRLALGVPPAEVWATLAADPQLGVLGRALARAESTGAPVADTVVGVAAELEQRRLAATEDRARAVGVKAAVPLGLCLLPAFLLLGIVPTVAGMLGSLLP